MPRRVHLVELDECAEPPDQRSTPTFEFHRNARSALLTTLDAPFAVALAADGTEVELAREVKRLFPRCHVVVGGEAEQDLVDAPWVDVLVHGHTARRVPAVLRALARGCGLGEVPGISFWADTGWERTVVTTVMPSPRVGG
ncbi:hypothetical protein KCV87_07575 [Actinosynnema pretiosum subsp. pretiosum]|uniref:Uncharacterized protein n=1 Tax=Actinosynnema pretiosum subsp. pretiosum TaxID=103721 RepID=A0AA45L9R1_9PSEU|nr:hypothetical protein [Actinosynnema mirum]QUF05921.1 hypothetical protein KCV87_07575 [Actinosynnema pretiosum subsp. pretiosum]